MPTLAIETFALRYSGRPQHSLSGIALVADAHAGLLGILASLKFIPKSAQVSTLIVELLPCPTAETAPAKAIPTPSRPKQVAENACRPTPALPFSEPE